MRDGSFVRIARSLHVLGDGAIVSDELLDDGARTTCERLVIVLHGPHGFDGSARRFSRDCVADEDDRDNGREAERETSTDTELQATGARRDWSRRHRRSRFARSDGAGFRRGCSWHKT